MLKHTLLHPEINYILGRAGHHSKVLIADGNYPASTKLGPNAEVVCLNFAPGLLTVSQVLEVLCTAIPIDVAGKTKVMSDEMIAPDGNDVTDAFLAYGRPLIGTDMPKASRLRGPSTGRFWMHRVCPCRWKRSASGTFMTRWLRTIMC